MISPPIFLGSVFGYVASMVVLGFKIGWVYANKHIAEAFGVTAEDET
jgi:hypothetical protein